MDNNEAFQKHVKEIQADVERLVRKVDMKPGVCVTGFVYSIRPEGLVKFGNIGNEGLDLVRLHSHLAFLAANEKNILCLNGQKLPFADLDFGQKSVGEAPEEIADALAKLILVTGMDENYAQKALELAQRYMLARRPVDDTVKNTDRV